MTFTHHLVIDNQTHRLVAFPHMSVLETLCHHPWRDHYCQSPANNIWISTHHACGKWNRREGERRMLS